MALEQNITDNLDQLIAILPPAIAAALRQLDDLDTLVEVVLDLGRVPEARFPDGGVDLGSEPVSQPDLEYVVERIGQFSGDNRAGIERTLHRISCIRNRTGAIVGLTCRVGRSVIGTIDLMRDLVESGRSILILGRPGVGKCVVGDTWIFTEQGMRSIAEFAPQGAEPESFHPLSVAVATPDGVERTSHVYVDGVRPTRRITTRMGYRLEGTTNHPVLVLEPGGDLVFKPLGKLGNGDFVALQRGQNLFGSTTTLPPFEFVARTNAREDVRTPDTLTPELARYLGYLVAEGTTTERYFTCFCQENQDVASDVSDLVETLFGLTLQPQVRHAGWNRRDYRIPTRKHRAFLAHLGIDYVRAAGKRIPDCVLRAPKPLVAEFLRGFFEGEASISRQSGVELASASAVMAHQIHVILLNFGIISHLRVRRNQQYQRDYYYLNIRGHNVTLFEREIGFVSSVKRQLLASISGDRRNPNLDVIPHLEASLLALRTQIASKQPEGRVLVGPRGALPTLPAARGLARPMLSKYTRTLQSPSYATLDRILAETEDLLESPIRQHLVALQGLGFYYDPVVSIAEGSAPVFDFTVPGSHSFCGNGLVNHNTTKLRELARVLSTDLKKRVIVIDTSNEIAGDGDIPHPAIGRARRMQVPAPALQHAVMIEAVENHMPEAIVIDEIGTEQEALAARTIAERGVQLIGTAHGNSIENLLMNPTLSDLIGGIHTVTLSDEEARRRGTQKSILERKAPPTFDIAVEMQDRDRLAIHQDVADVVDQMLRGYVPNPEIRQLSAAGAVQVIPPTLEDLSQRGTALTGEVGATIRLYPYAVSRSQLERVIRSMRLPVEITRNLSDADALLILKAYVKSATRLMQDAEARQIPTYVVKANTIAQIQKTLREVMHLDVQMISTEEDEALKEAREAIDRALMSGKTVELRPRNSHLRRLQHELAERHQLISQSMGEEPNRRVLIYPADVLEE
jgi:stage III sporulation protein SpoIIIAA/intein/homing endonuclease